MGRGLWERVSALPGFLSVPTVLGSGKGAAEGCYGQEEGRGKAGEREKQKSEVKRSQGEVKETLTPCLPGRALGIQALEPTGSQSVRHMPSPRKC